MTEGTIKPVKYVRIGSREVPIEAGCACCERIEQALASCVRVDQEQGFTDPEQAIGRANISAVTAAEAAAAAPVQSVNGMTGDVVIPSPVTSVNGQTGDVVLDAEDVGADPAGTAAAAVDAVYNPPVIIERMTDFRGTNVGLYGNALNAFAVALSDYSAVTNPQIASGFTVFFINTNTAGTGAGVGQRSGGTSPSLGFLDSGCWYTGDTMQAIFMAAANLRLPATGPDNFQHRYGLFYTGYYNGSTSFGAPYAVDPLADIVSAFPYDGAAAYFFCDNTSGFWKCRSGTESAEETTTTSIPVVLNEFYAMRVKVNANGSVQFWFNDTLVATHNTGVITNAKSLGEAACIVNLGTTTNAQKKMFLSSIGFRHEMGTPRTGFDFI